MSTDAQLAASFDAATAVTRTSIRSDGGDAYRADPTQPKPNHDGAPVTTPLPTNAQRIGARLRRIRNQQQLSLADVQQRSDGVWKAVVVGAYERGDRAITVARLAELAGFYGVPLSDLLPDTRERTETTLRAGADRDTAPDRVVLDLTRLDEKEPELGPVARFVDHVRGRRGDHNGRIMTLRGGDLETVAMAAGRTTREVVSELARAGALLTVDLTGAPTLTLAEADARAQATARTA